ncbi:MAG: hypothetical protein QM765_28300 [Myxococcales bacterium]
MTVRKSSARPPLAPQVERRGDDRRVESGAVPDGMERRKAERCAQYYQDGFDPPAKAPMELTFTPAIPSEAGGGATPDEGTELFGNDSGTAVENTESPVTESDEVVRALVQSTYRRLLRREPDPGGLAYWNGLAQNMARQGTSLDEIAGWLMLRLEAGPEFQALALVDQAFQDVLGQSVDGTRGTWHDQAVTKLRDEGQSAEEVDAWLRSSLRASDGPETRATGETCTITVEQLLKITPDLAPDRAAELFRT